MRNFLISSCSIALLAAAGAAMAADDAKPVDPPKTTVSASTPATSTPATSSTQAAGATPAKAAVDKLPHQKPDCIRETGTRIKLEKGKCSSMPGRSYSGDELLLNGQDTASALKHLDPALH